MCLNNFSSYFELLASLTVFYAGIEFFRNEIISAFNIPVWKDLEDSMKSISTNNGDINESLNDKIESQKAKIELQQKKFEEEETEARKFIDVFKSLSVFVFLYCLSGLIIGGFQSEVLEQKQLYFFHVFAFISLVITCIGICFLNGTWKVELKPQFIVIIYIVIIITSFISCPYLAKVTKSIIDGRFIFNINLTFLLNKILQIFILFVPCSLYLFLYIKVEKHKTIFNRKYNKIRNEFGKPLKDLAEALDRLNGD